MKKIISVLMVLIMVICIASANASTAREYSSLEDAIEKIGAIEISHDEFDLTEIVHQYGYFAAYLFVRGLFELQENEDVMILELDTGLAGVVYPIEDHNKMNNDKEILRIVLVNWT